MILIDLLGILTIIVVTAYVLTNLAYLSGAVLAARDLRVMERDLKRSVEREAFASPLTPGVSILVPARNEEMAIVDTVHSLLALRYPQFEIIVVVGGATDQTVQRLVTEFEMVPARRAARAAVACGPVDAVYVSIREPHLWLLRKPDAGKADALNAGVNAARYPYVATVDGDALLDESALIGVVQPILADPETVIGAGGMIRAVNGCEVVHGRVTQVRFPRELVSGIQVEEYLRSFLLMRTSLSGLNSLLIVSGAFGLFRRDLVEQVGGWFTGTAADDVEIVIHLHRYVRDNGLNYRIVFLPEPVCWTEVPHTLKDLLRQRRRWHRGLAEVLWRHRGVFARPRYGRLGAIAMPYLLLELIDPPVEVLAWLIVIMAAWLGILSIPVFLTFIAVSFVLNLVLSLAALTLGEVEYRRHATGREATRMVWYAIVEFFGYRQLVSAACVLGIVDFLRGRRYYTQPARRERSV